MRPAHKLLMAAGGLLVAGGLLAYFGVKYFTPERRGRGTEGAETAGLPTAGPDRGKVLYDNYCLSCHGEKGTGDGPAAVFLDPKPRDFGEAKFRLVSTTNWMPSDQDFLWVLDHGMPGSAMFPFAHLDAADRHALVEHVRRLTKAFLVDKQRAAAGEGADLEEITAEVERYLRPGPAVASTTFPPRSDESIARGKALFVSSGCHSCHGESGKGDGVQEQRDDRGMLTRPRDFTLGIFKGGRSPEQLYARIVLGMPGTPMPNSAQLKPDVVGDIINYILSLSAPSAYAKVEHQRRQLVAARVTTSFPATPDQDLWRAAQPVSIVVSPLWWRSYTPPELQVQALHDGATLAVRLNWLDASENTAAVRPQDFEDMAAVQLFKGSPEPFLGMGAADQPVDVWLWNPSGEASSAFADVGTAYPNMAVDLYPFEKTGAGPPHALAHQPEQFLTARAAGNPRSNPDRGFSGSSLAVKGLGTATMRPRVSQIVSAHGARKEGRWTVVLRRPLETGADAGIRLAAGDKLSIAFALWDGASRDRNGQKLVSVWHDLKLE